LAEEEKVFVIGIDPHRGSHTATVLDEREVVVDELRLVADRLQLDRLLSVAAGYAPRMWAVEGATGTGALVAQQLVAGGQTVLDVPPMLLAPGAGAGLWQERQERPPRCSLGCGGRAAAPQPSRGGVGLALLAVGHERAALVVLVVANALLWAPLLNWRRPT
jgi:hypothetical protein